MTIKELAERVEEYTGKPMSRQNMTQRLGRDNFQEQDMRMIAEILGCPFSLSIMEPAEEEQQVVYQEEAPARDITVGELVQDVEEDVEEDVEGDAEVATDDSNLADAMPEAQDDTDVNVEERNLLRKGIKGYFHKGEQISTQTILKEKKEETVIGDINPYTGKEYQSNSVRMHPKRIGYVQVYDQEQHKWTDMTEWAFLGYQERKKKLLGRDYKPPIYLD